METMDFEWTGEYKGFWEFQKEVLFDVQILIADTPSFLTKDLVFLFNAERDENKPKYNDAAEARRATLIPVLATGDGTFDHEATDYLLFCLRNEIKITIKYMGGWKQECKFAFYVQAAFA